MIVRQPLCATDGFTHADNVIAPPTFNAADPGTRTVEDPLNDTAPPYRPNVDQVAPMSVPVLPLPDASAVSRPAPSLNPHAPINPTGGAIAGVATWIGAEYAPRFPEVS